MSHKILTLLFTFLIGSASAQLVDSQKKPICAVFQYDGQYGIVDTLGNEIEPLGKYYSIKSFPGLNFFAILEKEEMDIKDYKFYDATTSKFFEMGELAEYDPIAQQGDSVYFHTFQNNKSVIISPTDKNHFVFDKKYKSIKKITLRDTSRINSYDYFLTKDDNYDYTIWSVKNNVISKTTAIAPFSNFELVITETATHYVPVGIAIEIDQPVKKVKISTTRSSPPEVKTTSPDDPVYAAVYNNQLSLKNKGFTTKENLTKLFGAPSWVRSNLGGGSPSIGTGIIKMTGDNYSVDLNDNFAIQKMIKGNYENYYFATKDGTTYTALIQVSAGEPSFVSFKNQKLLSLRLFDHKKITFIFDYDGIIFPKAKIMIPKSYLEKMNLKALLPYGL